MSVPALELGIYSIEDIKSTYIGLTTGYGDDDAVRSFAYALKQNKMWSENAADYRLVRVGSWNMESGVISPLASPRVLADGGQFIHLIKKEGVIDASDQ